MRSVVTFCTQAAIEIYLLHKPTQTSYKHVMMFDREPIYCLYEMSVITGLLVAYKACFWKAVLYRGHLMPSIVD